MSQRSLSRMLIVVAVVAVAAVIAVVMDNREGPGDGERLLLPALTAGINDAARVTLTEAGETVVLSRQDNQWGVDDKSSYAADIGQLRELLIQLSRLEIIEAKTAKPENYKKLGVQDVSKDSGNRRITVVDAADVVLADVIIGQRKGGVRVSHYVRRADEAASWLVRGDIRRTQGMESWLDKVLLNLPANDIVSVQLNHARNSDQIRLERDEKAKPVLANLPKGKTLKSEPELNRLFGALSNLRIDDVFPQSEFSFDQGKQVISRYTTKDGWVVNATVQKSDDRYYMKISASQNGGGDGENAGAVPGLMAMNSRAAGRVFIIPTATGELLSRSISALLE